MDPNTSIQFLGAIVPHVTRVYPFDGPLQTYAIFYSPLLDPPRQQGEPGDFFVGELNVYIKSERGRWNIAHFNLPGHHPLVDDSDLFEGLHLFYDHLGPGWTRSQLSPRLRRWQLRFRYVPVAVQFRRALAHHKRQPRSAPEYAIHLDD